jgi:hypothetical protein
MERDTVIQKVEQDIEEQLEKKRLPRGVRKRIRQLKQSGYLEEAMELRRRAREKKRPLLKIQKARAMLYDTVEEIFESDDPGKLAETQIRAVWLMQASGLITSEERIGSLMEIIDSSKKDGLDPEIEILLTKARNKYQELLGS